MKNTNSKNSQYLFLAYCLTLSCVLICLGCFLHCRCSCCRLGTANNVLIISGVILFIYHCVLSWFLFYKKEHLSCKAKEEESKKPIENTNKQVEIDIKAELDTLKNMLSELKKEIASETDNNKLLKDVIIGNKESADKNTPNQV